MNYLYIMDGDLFVVIFYCNKLLLLEVSTRYRYKTTVSTAREKDCAHRNHVY